MPELNTPGLGFSYRYDLGESGWNTGYDDNNWRVLDVLLRANVISASITAEPGSPANGDLYIVPPAATGTNWTGQDEALALWDGVGTGGADEWLFITPLDGMVFWAADENQPYQFDGSVWGLLGGAYSQYADDTAAGVGGVPIGGFYINSGTGALQVRLT